MGMGNLDVSARVAEEVIYSTLICYLMAKRT